MAHVTAVLVVFTTPAVSAFVSPRKTDGLCGEIVTVTSALTPTGTIALALGSARLIATTLYEPEIPGGLNVVLVGVVPVNVPPCGAVQDTPVFDALLTTAVNCCGVLPMRLADGGFTTTPT